MVKNVYSIIFRYTLRIICAHHIDWVYRSFVRSLFYFLCCCASYHDFLFFSYLIMVSKLRIDVIILYWKPIQFSIKMAKITRKKIEICQPVREKKTEFHKNSNEKWSWKMWKIIRINSNGICMCWDIFTVHSMSKVANFMVVWHSKMTNHSRAQHWHAEFCSFFSPALSLSLSLLYVIWRNIKCWSSLKHEIGNVKSRHAWWVFSWYYYYYECLRQTFISVEAVKFGFYVSWN